MSTALHQAIAIASASTALIADMGDQFWSSAGTALNCPLLMRLPNPAPALQCHSCSHGPWVQKVHPALGLGFGGGLLRDFHAPVLHWMNACLRRWWHARVSSVQHAYARALAAPMSRNSIPLATSWVREIDSFWQVAGCILGNLHILGLKLAFLGLLRFLARATLTPNWCYRFESNSFISRCQAQKEETLVWVENNRTSLLLFCFLNRSNMAILRPRMWILLRMINHAIFDLAHLQKRVGDFCKTVV